MSRTSLLILGHGSREASANAEFEHLVGMYRTRRPEYEVAHAYVELAEPLLDAALKELARRADRVIVLPLFLVAAGHVKHDVPRALARARLEHPNVRFEAAAHLGVDPAMVQVAVERAISASSASGIDPARTAVVVVGRGSSDPDANSDFYKLVRLFAEGQGFWWVEPCFIAVTRPGFEEAAEMVAHGRPDHLLVVPYFLFAGTLVARIEEQLRTFSGRHPAIHTSLAAHLAPHSDISRVLDVLDERCAQVLRVTSHPTAPDPPPPFDRNHQAPSDLGSSPRPGPATISYKVQRPDDTPKVASFFPAPWSHRCSRRPGG